MKQIALISLNVFLLTSLTALSGCANLKPQDTPPPSTCEIGDTAMIRDVLYFGRNRPDGGIVSNSEWQKFLDEVVTPRFPSGLTVVEAQGQWKGEKSGLVEKERSEIVTLLHPDDAASKKAVLELTDEYKRRFKQEAVLRERINTCASF